MRWDLFRERSATDRFLSEDKGEAMKFTYSGTELSGGEEEPKGGASADSGADERSMTGNPCVTAARWIWNSTLVRLVLVVAVSVFVLTRFMDGAMSQMLIGTLMLSVQAAVVELIMGAVRRKNLQRVGSGNERACRRRKWNWLAWFVAFFFWAAGTALWLQYYRIFFNV